MLALVPFLLIALTLWGIWWYVVIHQQAVTEAAAVPAVQQLVVILCMVIMYLWPGMTLWLPAYLYGGS